ncbi:PREDICTED: uncharacterized protein LOC108562022 [Nicrophorus vespilloides]|uniref:Uncharacterized protein LOC108562022 n=1 Tax=Nicrophorus vespilloides TaxID=110193 RepID=A0ABM1MM87_NICVS|nr:PREDICTED: uncharacterized protein LOC108562022 [Nicrophorus vespilloides]
MAELLAERRLSMIDWLRDDDDVVMMMMVRDDVVGDGGDGDDGTTTVDSWRNQSGRWIRAGGAGSGCPFRRINFIKVEPRVPGCKEAQEFFCEDSKTHKKREGKAMTSDVEERGNGGEEVASFKDLAAH